MIGEVVLTSFVEVGIGIAGFSSIVAALSRKAITEDMKVAFLQIWIQSGAIIIFSSAPLILESSQVDRDLIYVISSYLYGGFLAIIMTIGPIRKRVKVHPILSVGYSFPVIVLVNAVFFGEAWPYLLVLLAGIAIAFLSFYQLIRDVWVSETGA